MIKDFYVKNMVCDRCITVLKDELRENNIELLAMELGHLKLNIKRKDEIKILESLLEKNGFSLIFSTEEKITEQIKVELIKILQELPLDLQSKLSTYLADKLGQEYSKISKVFSFTEGVTVEKYFIKLKMEKVKELVQNKQLNFTEMSQLLNYSHVNHLSRQFKSDTGMSLSSYKSQQKNLRNSLDRII